MTPTQSRAATLATFFRARPDQWIDGRSLEFAGRYAWRTRVSDLRRAPYFMTIQNRQRRVARDDGRTFVVSEYRWVPGEAIRTGVAGERECAPQLLSQR
jgi:hypothetical protein